MVRSKISKAGKINNLSWQIRLFGAVFDVAQLGLSVTDAISDAAVTWEFNQNNQMGFFYATSLLLLIGCISDAVAFLVSIEKKYRMNNWYDWVIWVPLLTPLAPLLPVVSYCLEKFGDGWSQDIAEYVRWEERDTIFGADREPGAQNSGLLGTSNANDKDSGDAAREIHKKASDQDTLIALDEFVASRQTGFLVMNCQTIAESAPQCIVQLIAISLVDAPTTLQVVSLSLSLFGVASKTFQLCRSFTPSAFFAKLFFVVHDIFSISFLFSSLFSATLPKTSTFFGLEVCDLTWWWLLIKFVDVTSIIFIMIVVAGNEVYNEAGTTQKLKLVGLFAMFFCLGVVPISIVQETCKLAWYLPLNLSFTPSTHLIPRMPLLHSFLWGGSGEMKRQFTNWADTFNKFELHILGLVVAAETALEHNAAEAKMAARFSHQGPYARNIARRGVLSAATQPIGPTFRRLAQPVAVDENEFGYEESEKRDGVVPRRDNFWTRVLHCVRIHHGEKISKGMEGFDSYYNHNKRPTDYVVEALVSNSNQYFGKNDFDFRDNNVKVDFYEMFIAPLLRKSKTVHETAMHSVNVRERLKQVVAFIHSKNKGENDKKLQEGNTDGDGDEIAHSVANNNSNPLFPAAATPIPVPAAPVPRSPIEFKKVLAVCAFVTIIAVSATTSLFGLVYPLVFAYNYFGTMQLMQQVCFYPTIICLVGAVVCIPAAIRYQLTCMIARNSLCACAETFGLMVDTYFSVPITTVRAVAIPDSRVIPQLCVDEHVLPFLDSKMCGLFGLFGEAYENVEKLLSTTTEEEGKEDSKKRE